MNATAFSVRYNVMTLSSIGAFASIAGRMQGGCKDVYFLRGIGCTASYLTEIQQMDVLLQERQTQGRVVYLRLGDLPKLAKPEDVAVFSHCYDTWEQDTKAAPKLSVSAQNQALGEALAGALSKVGEHFRQSPHVSASMERNLVVKLLFWLEQTLAPLLGSWSLEASMKFVYTGAVKKTEYLLCYLLSLLGVDVLILSPSGPIDLEADWLALSHGLHLGAATEVVIPAYKPTPTPSTPEPSVHSKEHTSTRRVLNVRRADRDVAPTAVRPVTAGRPELAFEELARLASSVVMIEVLDDTGEVITGGSGIMVSEDGYILTNHHVASKGVAFSIHIEEDDSLYQTDELIKTHALLDLALIRIDRKLRPIPVYRQTEPLVRGQKVVAIGSPLGLFNSVSNGIISGFRNIETVPMIQFTAPTSPGSSGGALLNMQGEVIGISTAGIDRGQNLNLAVGYQSILPFIQGFLK